MLIDKKLLDEVTERAKGSERLRINYNLHDNLEAKAQRLLNALEPGTLLPVHRHRHTAETYIVLRGSIRVMFYNDERVLTDEFIVHPEEKVYGVHIPAGQWHTLEVMESGTVIFEVKDGPYAHLKPEDIMISETKSLK
ncbi:MAG: WbuC family cupin fold metalloprotein [Bacteroidales bacterium]|nr:WbuC family cupin fold metalloprotein [Bacteroidales bacterium]